MNTDTINRKFRQAKKVLENPLRKRDECHSTLRMLNLIPCSDLDMYGLYDQYETLRRAIIVEIAEFDKVRAARSSGSCVAERPRNAFLEELRAKGCGFGVR